MSYPLYYITSNLEKGFVELPDEDDMFDKIPDCDNVSQNEDSEDKDNLAECLSASMENVFPGFDISVWGGEPGVRLIVPKGAIHKFVKGRLEYVRGQLGSGNNLALEDKLIRGIAAGTCFDIADVFAKTYLATLWYDEDWANFPEDTIRYFGKDILDNLEKDSIYRVYGVYYHK